MSTSSNSSERPAKAAKVNIAILTFNALDYTKMCLESIAKNTRVEHNVFVLDNGSTDGTRAWLREQNRPNFYWAEAASNLGVPGGRNQLIRIIQPQLPDDGYIVFADNDMELREGWENVYLDFFRDHPGAGIASAFGHRMIVRKTYRELLPPPAYTAPVDVACGGFACWVSASAIKAVGGFDEKLGLFWHEDDDFSVRTLAAGFDVYALPHVPVVHHEHKSGAANPGIKSGGSPKNQAYLCEKWRTLGIVDCEGRIIRKGQAPARNHPDMGGYRWIGPHAELLRLARSGRPDMVTLQVACAKRDFYQTFPFSVEVQVDDQACARLTFAQDDECHEISLLVKANSTVRFTTDAWFIPALCGLGCGSGSSLSLRVSEQTLSHASTWNSDWEIRVAPDSAKLDLIWSSPVCENDNYWGLSSMLIPALRKMGRAVRVEVSSVNESLLAQMKSDESWFDLWNELIACKGNAEILVSAQSPLSFGGESTFDALRARHPQIRRLIGLVIPPQEHNIQAWCRAADRADELWVLSEDERARILVEGLAPSKVKVMPFPVNSAISAKGSELSASLIENRFCFLTYVASPDDPFLRVSITAFLKAFSKDAPVCMFVSIPPVGGVLGPEILRSLALEAVDPEACAPVFTMDPNLPPRKRAALFSSTQCVVMRADTDNRATLVEAAATGVPILMADPVKGSCVQISESAEILIEQMRRSVRPVSRGEMDAAVTSSSLIEVCAQAMRHSVAEHAAISTRARLCAVEVHSRFGGGESEAWIQKQLELSSSALARPLVVEKAISPETAIIEIGAEAVCIGVDARTLTCPENIERGIGHYTVNHLKEIIGSTPTWHYRLYRNEGEDSALLQQLSNYPNVAVAEIGTRLRERLDLYHIADPMTILPGFDSPLLLAPNVPVSMVFYDLIPLVKREMHLDRWEDWRRKAYTQRLAQLRESQAHVLAISECTRQDLHRAIAYPLERITAIMAGINRAASSEMPTQEQAQTVLSKFALRAPFFMSVGGLDGHKGFLATAQAYAELSKQRNVQFAIVGSFNDPYKEQYRKVFEQNNIRGVVFTGYLSREEMACLFAASAGLVFPSHYEGFGFPVVEAMAHGCPVITTNVSSLPEVAGGAALLVNPEDAAGIADAMRRLIDEPDLRPSMVKKGLAQAQKFSWALTARRTLAVWNQMLDQGRSVRISPATFESNLDRGLARSF